jgi:UDP-glucose 4-epimerase
MTKVLVTGGAGFIGSHTVEILLNKGYEVTVLDNFHSSSLDNVRGLRAEIRKVDVRNLERMKEEVEEAEAIVHLAAIVSLDEALENPQLTLEVNVVGTLNVLELARLRDVKKLVYASSVAVYGEPSKLPVEEGMELKPINLYGYSKLAGEELAELYHEAYGLDIISLRYFNVYGPRMRRGPYSGVICKFLERLSKGLPPVIHGDGGQTRDFVYVKDVAKANLMAMESDLSHEVFNVGTGREVSIIELSRALSQIFDREFDPAFGPPRLGDIRRSCADISKIEHALGWRPETKLKDGLRETVKWFIDGPLYIRV